MFGWIPAEQEHREVEGPQVRRFARSSVLAPSAHQYEVRHTCGAADGPAVYKHHSRSSCERSGCSERSITMVYLLVTDGYYYIHLLLWH